VHVQVYLYAAVIRRKRWAKSGNVQVKAMLFWKLVVLVLKMCYLGVSC
jgi:hypothetical protein